MKNHVKGDIYCSCGNCPHDNSFQCADCGCTCCVGSAGKPYELHYLKSAGKPAFNF
jgi:hypothetical protein